MGSFNVTCGVSSIPIVEGERTGVQLLEQKTTKDYRDDKSLIMTPARFYKLVSAPFYGTYDAYGRVVSIEATENTKALEQYFHMSIEQLVEVISDVRSVYDRYGMLYDIFMDKEHLLYDENASFIDVLLSLGFSLKEPDKPNTSQSTGTTTLTYHSSTVVVSDTHIQEIRYRRKHFKDVAIHSRSSAAQQLHMYADLTGLYPGVDAQYFEALQSLHNIDIMFFHPRVVEAMNAHALRYPLQQSIAERHAENIAEYVEMQQKIQNLKMQLEDHSLEEGERYDIGSDINIAKFDAYYLIMTILKDELSPTHRFATLHTHMPSEDIQNILALCRAMEQSKHVFMPSLYASEDDSFDAGLALSKITQNILEERKRVIEEY